MAVVAQGRARAVAAQVGVGHRFELGADAPGDDQAFHKQVNAATVDPDFILGVRKKLDLGQPEAAELFGGGVNALLALRNRQDPPAAGLGEAAEGAGSTPGVAGRGAGGVMANHCVIPIAQGTCQADLQALRDAADKLEAVLSLTEDEVESSVRDFDALRKGAAACRRAPK
jgi:hypothetical protein